MLFLDLIRRNLPMFVDSVPTNIQSFLSDSEMLAGHINCNLNDNEGSMRTEACIFQEE